MINDDLLNKLTTTQLQDLRHRLNQTNESTTVLIPVGPRAFREATLRLDKLSWSKTSVEKSSGDEGNYVSKEKAIGILQRTINKRLPKKESPGSGESENEDEEKQSGQLPKNNTTSTQPTFPFIEIREEVNDEGKLLRTETVDVTDHLKQLGNANSLDVTRKSDDSEALFEQDPQPRLLADEEFNKLSDRLDKLAMMEEAGEELQSKTRPQIEKPVLNTKPPAMKGWSKGFLNKPTKKKSVNKPHGSCAAKVSTGKTVSFGEDTVCEIPKEGNQNPLPSRPSRPIDSNIFNGVVQERPRRKTSDEGMQTTKKLSRFAQERLQGFR